jgi:hypothetical protein
LRDGEYQGAQQGEEGPEGGHGKTPCFPEVKRKVSIALAPQDAFRPQVVLAITGDGSENALTRTVSIQSVWMPDIFHDSKEHTYMQVILF